MRNNSSARWTFPFILLVPLLTACAANVVVQRRPGQDTGPQGPFLRCEPGQRACQEDRTYDSARFNQSDTTFFSLPDCPHGVMRILVENAGKKDAVVIAQCAARAQAPDAGAWGQ